MKTKAERLHPYHCILCGTQLFEIGMGFLKCPICETEFLPTANSDGKNLNLSWINTETHG